LGSGLCSGFGTRNSGALRRVKLLVIEPKKKRMTPPVTPYL
jgi:hypothetical protein